MEQPQRARSDAQKQQRRQAILATAWEMYQAIPYDEITIASVAERVGVAKGTFYLYFRTKEELFLALQQEQLGNWFDTLNQQLQASSGQLRADELAALISESVIRQPHFTRLLAILHPIIEQNIEQATARNFKQFIHDRLAESGPLIERYAALQTPGSGAQLLLWVYALVIGFRHMADPSPVVQEVLSDPALRDLVVNFNTDFTAALHALVIGFVAKEQSNGN